jgi:ABC-type multidrug transport system ATPase subunit
MKYDGVGPLALLVTRVIRDPESVVVAVPVGTFILLLPGLLYGDLAFEVQRSLVIETLLCLSPVSGTALILRHLCATESLGITAGWNSSLPTSGTTISWLLTTLVLDCVFYSWLTVHILEVDSSVARFKNSFEVNDPKLLVCHKINKSFDRHEVLRDVSCELIAGQVVGLLGSNGAGKSTLMRIIGGFDNDYLGVVTFSSGIYGRSLGWCPQGDALFEQLTVEEHVLLYLNILGLTPDMTHDILESVGLVNHKHKQINILSGGMRRRLCLAIACCNHPQVILLDEPTTGCDSESRDLVRMKILRLSREGCAILISTHHMDDIEIICDQVWFLNDRILSFSGPPHSLILRNGMSDQDFELEVNSIEVENCFLDIYPPVISDQWIVHERIFPQTSKKIWRIPEKARKEKIGSQSVITLLLSKLESLNCTGWKISTPSLEDSLISLYQEKNIHEYIYPPLPSNHRSTTKSMFSEISIFWYQLVAAIGLRFSSLRSKRGFWTFLLQYGLFPFVVTLLVSVCCSDVNYPPLELSSGRIGGLGPLQFSRGTAFISETVLDRVVQRLKSELKLNLEFGEIDNSNNVIKKFTYLPDPVNHFSERQRLCALVIGDIVPDSVESTIALVPSSFNMSASELQFKLLAIQSSICSISENTDSSTCNVKIDILNSNEGPVVSISTKKSLSSNITLLTNTAAPHAGPICLKELVDDSLFWTSSSLQNTSYLGSSFTLYNHPLPLTDSSSPQFAERGYLGGAVIILFIFICTTPSSQTVVRLRSTGVKLQMHLAGITPSVFWIAHLLCDSGILILSFLAVYFAIMVGGPPVHGFFFQFSFWIFIEVVICFALAVTSANFGLFVTSSNFLSTQLLSLISAVFNGMFLKLFLDRHKSYNLAKDILFFISPSFVFSTAIFDLFKEHSTALLSLSRISRLSSTFHYQYLCFHFICQTLGYIALAIIVDRWLNSINSFIARIYLKTLKLVDIVLKAFYSLRMCSSRSYEAVDRGEESSLLKTRSNNKTSHGIQSNYGAFDSQPPFFNQKIFQDKSRNRNNEDDSTLSEMDLFSKSQLKRDSRYIQSQNNIDIKIESNNLDDSNKNSINAILSIENLILLPSQTIPINTTILQGENVSLIGLNGGGKSTLFRTITLSDTPILVGNIKINGFDLLNQQWNTTSSRLIGYVSQFGGLLEDNDVTVEDTLHFFSQLSNISNIDHKINVREMTRKEWNEKWFIPDRYRFFPVRALSSGNKRKLSLTIAQEHKPCLLLLDECTSGVDPLAADEMIRYLRRCRIEDVNNRMNGSMLFSSHRLDECVTLCDRLLMLHEGMIIFDGPSESLLQQMEEFYRVDISIFSPGIITTKNQQEFCDELLGANQETERILWYSPSLLRLIIHNKRSPLSHIISKLEQLREYGTVRNYKIKKVDLEEALTILSSKVNQK